MVDGVLPSLGYANYMLQGIREFSQMEMPSLNSFTLFVMWRVILSSSIQHIYRHFPFNVSGKVISDIWETLNLSFLLKMERLAAVEKVV